MGKAWGARWAWMHSLYAYSSADKICTFSKVTVVAACGSAGEYSSLVAKNATPDSLDMLRPGCAIIHFSDCLLHLNVVVVVVVVVVEAFTYGVVVISLRRVLRSSC